MSDTDTQQRATRRTVIKLVLATCVMFSFGYALVPLYNVFCTITGLNGKTGRMTEAQAAALPVDLSREVTVEFVTNVDAQMPWDFKPIVNKVVVHPGVETQVEFEVHNWDAGRIDGNAVPSVAPNTVAKYFKKTECFCFTQQTLAPGETRRMPVRFVVDPRLPPEVKVLTLGYTFFQSLKPVAENAAAALPRS
ncbi:MAG: cytochrome c oxidase assembly protein [Gammaproteobacteria bacterium]|jgi:cytochrome c oxidase assembly protein subunit 11|nr:cytochrome c oxidase assembly protein [Gammaproteobacteria bacterium]